MNSGSVAGPARYRIGLTSAQGLSAILLLLVVVLTTPSFAHAQHDVPAVVEDRSGWVAAPGIGLQPGNSEFLGMYGPWLAPVAVVAPSRQGGNTVGNVALDLTLANGIPWFLNRYARDMSWAKVGVRSWGQNLASAPEWDSNSFNANHIDHPVHGGMYFTAGRVNGLGFWASAPLAPLGSAIWEYFAETNTPSLNDLVITSIGGIAVGEATFRASELIIDDRATGINRALREFTAFLVSPGVGIHRVVRGKAWRGAPDLPELGDAPARQRPTLEATLGMGARSITMPGTPLQQGLVTFDMRYGDPFAAGSWQAFQAFSLRATVVTGQYPALTDLAISGTLGRTALWGDNAPAGVLGATLDYEVTAFPGFSWSGPKLAAVLVSRAGNGPVRAVISGRAGFLPLSAVGSEFAAEAINRPYDYGSGVSAGMDIALRHRAGVHLEARYDLSQVWAQSAAALQHQVSQLAVRARVPLPAGLAAHAEYLRTGQRSLMPGDVVVQRTFPEVRLMMSTLVGSPSQRAN